MRKKKNPAGVVLESGWLDRGQERGLRLLTIVAESMIGKRYNDELIENPQTYDQVAGLIRKFMPRFKLQDCSEKKSNSKYWASMRMLMQTLPLYANLKDYQMRTGNKFAGQVLEWFEDILSEEISQIIDGKQEFIPENQEE